jgi:hypothetical protein
MTQDELDDIVVALADRHVDVMVKACDLRRQGDPEARRIEEEQMLVQNCLSALKDYDVTSDVLTEDDIAYNIELITGATLMYP